MSFFNSVDGLLGNLLENYGLLNDPEVRVRLLDLVLPFPQVSDDKKIQLIEGLIDADTLQSNSHLILDRLELLHPVQRKTALEKLIDRLISQQLFEAVLLETLDREAILVGLPDFRGIRKVHFGAFGVHRGRVGQTAGP